MITARYFNTEGCCRPDLHYMVPLAAYTTRLAMLPLVLTISLTACQSNVPQQETPLETASSCTTPPDPLPETAETVTDSSSETADSEPILIYTGIQSTVTEHDADYPYYPELKKYLDDKQFSLMRIAHQNQSELYEGDEALEWDSQDWDLVQPPDQITYYDCGYGKIDLDNDGTMEILYRAIDDTKELSATLYQTDDTAGQITAESDLLDTFHDALPQDSIIQQLWFKQIGEKIVTFRLLQLHGSEEFILYSDLVTSDGETTACSRLETRRLTVTTAFADTAGQARELDIFQERVLNLAEGEGEAFQALRRKQLIQYQENRLIHPAPETSVLPEGLCDLLKEVLAGTHRYTYTWDMEALSAYEAAANLLTEEQVKTYLGEVFTDYYAWELITCAYLADMDKDGREELALYCDSGGTAGFTDMDIWQLPEDGEPKLLLTAPMQRGYAKMLEYDNIYYFVARHYNFYTGETNGFYIAAADADNTLQLYSLNLENKEDKKQWIETYRNAEMDPHLEQALTDYIDTIRRDVEVKTVSNDDYQLIDGNAEIPYAEAGVTFPLDAFSCDQYDEQCSRIVDLDNDGSVECIRKSIWYPSSLNSVLGLTIALYKEFDSYVHPTWLYFPCFTSLDRADYYPHSLGTVVDDTEMFETTSVQLWFQAFDQKVYTFYMKRIGQSSDYLLEVSLIEDEQLQPLLQYLLIAEKEYTFKCPDAQ